MLKIRYDMSTPLVQAAQRGVMSLVSPDTKPANKQPGVLTAGFTMVIPPVLIIMKLLRLPGA